MNARALKIRVTCFGVDKPETLRALNKVAHLLAKEVRSGSHIYPPSLPRSLAPSSSRFVKLIMDCRDSQVMPCLCTIKLPT